MTVTTTTQAGTQQANNSGTTTMTSSAASTPRRNSPYRHNPYNAVTSKVFYAQTAEYQKQSPARVGSLYHHHNAAANISSGYHHQQQQQEQQYINYYATEDYCSSASCNNSIISSITNQEEDQFNTADMFTMCPPEGTLHINALGNRMHFCLYPTGAFENLNPLLPKRQMVRMFIGQLPYHVTEMQLGWLAYTFGGGANLYHFERITKTDHSKGGIKVPTGCFHVHTAAEQVGPLLSLLNDRILVDDTGIWVADTPQEVDVLGRYCHGMKVDKTQRFQGRPYGTVVAQVSTSTFDPDTHHNQGGAGFRRHC